MLNFNSSDNTHSSVAKFEQMLKTDQVFYFDSEEFEDVIVHYLSIGKKQLAQKALKMGLEQHPECVDLLLLKSEMLIMDSEFELAEHLLKYIERLAADAEEILLQKSAIASKTGKHEKAIALLNEALKITEDPFEIWGLLGTEYLLVENYEQAQYYFKCCVEEDIEDYTSLHNLLFCYEQLEQTQEAIAILNDILEENPYSEVAWHQMGLFLTAQGRYDEALSAFDFTLISDDTFVSAYIEKGKLLERKKQYNEALSNYEIALGMVNSSAYLLGRMGACHLILGNEKCAIDLFLKAVHNDPASEHGWIALIDYYIDKKEFTKAKHYVYKALKINSDVIELWKQSATIHHHFDLFDELQLAYQQMILLGDLQRNTWISLIEILIKLHEWQQALQIAKEFESIFPDDEEVLCLMAGCYLRMGKMQKARKSFEWAVRNTKPKASFLALFPEFENHAAKLRL